MLKKKPYRAPATMPMTAQTGTTYSRIVMAVGLVAQNTGDDDTIRHANTAMNPKCRGGPSTKGSKSAFEMGLPFSWSIEFNSTRIVCGRGNDLARGGYSREQQSP